MDKLKFETPDMVSDNIEKIAALFPSAITEMRGEDGEIKKGINFEVLKQLLSRDVVDGDECYEFTWVGKKAAMAEAARPITKTLRPVKEDSRDWDSTENLYIEGDNLEVLKILQESYLGKVKMIYIDPPYNTGHDFVYRDKFQRSQQKENEQLGMMDENDNCLFENTESNGRFHSDWCSMMYARLILAKNLLSDDGLIFISIDDNEAVNIKKMADEIFGGLNFLSQCIRRTINSGKHDVTTIAPFHEYVLIYAKNLDKIVLAKKPKDSGERDRLYKESDEFVNDRGRYYITQLNKNSLQYSDGLNYPITGPDGVDIWPGGGFNDKVWIWRWSKEKVKWGIENNYIVFKKVDGKYKVYTKSYEFRDKDGNPIDRSNPYTTLEFAGKEYANFNATPELERVFDGKKVFDFPKSLAFVKELIKIANMKTNNIILDFFSGSSTTAHAVMQLNAEDGGHRKFIMVQLPEPCDEKSEAYKAGYKNICEIGKERIRRAGDKIKAEHPDADLDIGFRVFRVDESNMKNVYYHPEELTQLTIGETVSNIKDDRSDLDLLYACLLDWGVEISLPHTAETVDGCTVHNVDNGALMACFNEHVPIAVVEHMAKQQPLRAVFRDNAFATDADKINVTEIFKNLSPDTKVKVI